VTGRIPERKAPQDVDRKLITRYALDVSRWTRARHKRLGIARVQYLRFGRFFVLLATHGRHRFFEEEVAAIRDVRRRPLRFHGYSIGFRGGHPHVRIEQEEYKRLKGYFLGQALRRSTDALAGELARIPFELSAPVRRHFLALLRTVNHPRIIAGLEPVPATCLRLRRRIHRPFEPLSPAKEYASEK
jgi:hypothetical protein